MNYYDIAGPNAKLHKQLCIILDQYFNIQRNATDEQKQIYNQHLEDEIMFVHCNSDINYERMNGYYNMPGPLINDYDISTYRQLSNLIRELCSKNNSDMSQRLIYYETLMSIYSTVGYTK